MGLNVCVYGNIKLSKNEDEAVFTAYVIDKKWDYKIKNLINEGEYVADKIYSGVSYPYFTHNRFREKLIGIIGRDDLLDSQGKVKWSELTDDLPFYDFIDFADNEGCLDWEISEKIYGDFSKYHNVAKNTLNFIDIEHYEIWLETFKFATENKGVVEFY